MPVGGGVPAEHDRDGAAQLAEGEDVAPCQGRRSSRQPAQVSLVRVGLAEPGQPGIGIELDDRSQRVRLVYADRIQQRRVVECDRSDPDAGNAHRSGGRRCACRWLSCRASPHALAAFPGRAAWSSPTVRVRRRMLHGHLGARAAAERFPGPYMYKPPLTG